MSVKNTVSAAKTAQLNSKRARSEGAYLRAIGAKETKADIAFAATAMHSGQVRGAIALALCTLGKGKHTFEEIAEQASVEVEYVRPEIKYIARNFAFRADLVGFALSADDETVRVYTATHDEKVAAVRKAAQLSGRSAAKIAEISGLVLSKPAKASKPASEAEAA
jgi:acylphosphatase